MTLLRLSLRGTQFHSFIKHSRLHWNYKLWCVGILLPQCPKRTWPREGKWYTFVEWMLMNLLHKRCFQVLYIGIWKEEMDSNISSKEAAHFFNWMELGYLFVFWIDSCLRQGFTLDLEFSLLFNIIT